MEISTFPSETLKHNNRMHSDKIMLHSEAEQLYFTGDAGR